MGNPFLYRGERLDPETGHHYTGRYLNTEQGRFIERYPGGYQFSAGNPRGPAPTDRDDWFDLFETSDPGDPWSRPEVARLTLDLLDKHTGSLEILLVARPPESSGVTWLETIHRFGTNVSTGQRGDSTLDPDLLFFNYANPQGSAGGNWGDSPSGGCGSTLDPDVLFFNYANPQGP